MESKKPRLEWNELTLIWRAAAAVAAAASGPQWSRAATFGQKICSLSLVLTQYSDVLVEKNLVQLGQNEKTHFSIRIHLSSVHENVSFQVG